MQILSNCWTRLIPVRSRPWRTKTVSCMAQDQFSVRAYARDPDSSTKLINTYFKEPLPLTVNNNTNWVHVQGGPIAADEGLFSVQKYFDRLSTQQLGNILMAAGDLPSTQTLFQENFGSLPNGAVCVANRQVSGKGRGGNTWASPPGCLMFSFHQRLNVPGARLPFVQYIVSLALVQAIEEEARKLLMGTGLDVRIKWPNDIYCGGLKLGGILCHSTYRDQQFHLVAGVGLNLDNAEPTTCINALIDAQHRGLGMPPPSPQVEKEVLLASILTKLENLLHILETEGFAPLQDAYLAAWLHTNQQVLLEEGHDDCTRQEPVTITGLSDNGYLSATDATGRTVELHPDGNSLDFFHGLVKAKR